MHKPAPMPFPRMTHLRALEAEAIHILREVVAEKQNPCLFYSIGKDSTVLLHLARKAFFPGPIPFPLLHVDTTWKFRAMYEMRERMAKELGFELLVHKNPEAVERNINPFDHGSSLYTEIMRTVPLKQAITELLYRYCRAVDRIDIPLGHSIWHDDAQADCYNLAEERLVAAGYSAYEVSNWSRPGHESRHNLAYWHSEDWWGIGPGAHSHVAGVRWWNHKHPSTYAKALAGGQSPEADREVLDRSTHTIVAQVEARAAILRTARESAAQAAE